MEREKKIGLITYNYSHLKTQQVLKGMVELHKEYKYTIFALPYYPRKKRDVIFEHRPRQDNCIGVENIAKKYNIELVKCDSDIDIYEGLDVYLITGAGIISEEALKGKKIINCHPGIIPLVRGLDAFKWAVLEKIPIGNTLHYIDENVDHGQVIFIKETELITTDTIESFALKHYLSEIEMLVNFERYICESNKAKSDYKVRSAKRRMKKSDELKMISSFDDYKRIYAKDIEMR